MLQAHYTFSGSADDFSGNDRHGVINGAVSLTSDRFGFPECAYSFDGDTATYIKVAYDPAFEYTGGNAISISLWYKGGSSDFADFECLFGQWTGISMTPYALHLVLYDMNQANINGVVWEPYETVDTGGTEWHHIVGTYNDSDNMMTLYRDNVLVGSAVGPALSPSTGHFVIGRNFEGVIDDVRVYNRLISATDVDSIYNLSSSCSTLGLDDSDLSSYVLYPNPSTGLVTIESPVALTGTEVSVYDVMGRMILRHELDNSSRHQIDLSQQPDGMYFIKFQNGSNQLTEVIQKIN